jgi:hypothetical protein
MATILDSVQRVMAGDEGLPDAARRAGREALVAVP